MQNLAYSLLIASSLVLATGCNESRPGANDKVSFTPLDCGRLGGCRFDDSIGVGGVIHVHIDGIGGVSTAGVTLESDDPLVLDVVPTSNVGGRPTWELFGANPGVARLIAYDANDEELDFIEVSVQALTGLTLENFIGDAVGPAADGTGAYDEVWTVNAGEPVSFYVTPLIGAGVPTMGRYDYDVTLDELLLDYVETPDNLTKGELYITPPAGEYWVTFDNLTGHRLDVLIIAQ